MRGECSKYGPVEHVYVDRNSRGFVYVVSRQLQSCKGCRVASRLLVRQPCMQVCWGAEYHTAEPLLLGRSSWARSMQLSQVCGGSHWLPTCCWISARCLPLFTHHSLHSLPQKFSAVPSASAAQKALHGRWFAARQIAADFQVSWVWATAAASLGHGAMPSWAWSVLAASWRLACHAARLCASHPLQVAT